MSKTATFKHHLPAQIRFSDVDPFGHVNNSVYFSLYDLAKSAYLNEALAPISWDETALVVANINCDFLAPIFFNEPIRIDTCVTHIGNKSIRLEQRAVHTETREVKCVCRTIMVAYDTKAKCAIPIPDHIRRDICRYEEVSLEELQADDVA